MSAGFLVEQSPYRIVRDPDGLITLLDALTEDRVTLSEMDEGDRIDFFESLSLNAQITLPDNMQIRADKTGKIIYITLTEDLGYSEGDKPEAVIKTSLISDKYLKIDWMDSTIPGGGTVLLAEVLRHHPQVDRIYSELDHTNLEVYQDCVKRGQSHEEALRQTPAYKIRAKCGFGVILLDEGLKENHRPILLTTHF